MPVTYYRQCLLFRGKTFQYAWIPEEYAVEGKVLRLKKDDGWRVAQVGLNRLDSEYLSTRESEYRHHRDVTDI